MEPPGSARPKRSSSRRQDALANDERILEAALELAASEGWAGLGFPRLSAVTGLSLPPIRARFENRADLAAALWRTRISETFIGCLQAVVEAVPAPGAKGEHLDAACEAMVAAMARFEHPDARMLAASELLIMSRVDDSLADAVEASMQTLTGALPRGSISTAQAARHAVAIAEALGLLLLARGIPAPAAEVSGPLVAMVHAMSLDASPRDLPIERAEHLDLGTVFATGDPAWDALLQATLNEIGARGFDAATLDVIAQAAGYSRGIIQNRYPSKKAVFLDATKRMLAAAVILNEEYKVSLGRRYSPGMADAALMREFMDPARRLVRSISLEQMRMSWHDEEVADVMAAEVARARGQVGGPDETAAEMASAWHFALALGQGAGLLADLVPETASLPYDVVFVPLHEPA